jgi:uncharacterized Zn-binding protein involved in type VI secretion
VSKPIALKGDRHTCPMSDGTKPHVGGEIVDGCDRVLVAGKPVAVVGARCNCQSPAPNAIALGASRIKVAGVTIARLGDSTSHGGKVIASSKNVIAG